jgi:hypothetical protein
VSWLFVVVWRWGAADATIAKLEILSREKTSRVSFRKVAHTPPLKAAQTPRA